MSAQSTILRLKCDKAIAEARLAGATDEQIIKALAENLSPDELAQIARELGIFEPRAGDLDQAMLGVVKAAQARTQGRGAQPVTKARGGRLAQGAGSWSPDFEDMAKSAAAKPHVKKGLAEDDARLEVLKARCRKIASDVRREN